MKEEQNIHPFSDAQATIDLTLDSDAGSEVDSSREAQIKP